VRLLAVERLWRTALLEAMIPAPRPGLPAMAELDLDAFWLRFDEIAPAHLQLGMRAAAWPVAVALPLALGYRRPLHLLDAEQRDAVLQRAATLPVASSLLEIVKLVACLAYFDAERVQLGVRGGPAS